VRKQACEHTHARDFHSHTSMAASSFCSSRRLNSSVMIDAAIESPNLGRDEKCDHRMNPPPPPKIYLKIDIPNRFANRRDFFGSKDHDVSRKNKKQKNCEHAHILLHTHTPPENNILVSKSMAGVPSGRFRATLLLRTIHMRSQRFGGVSGVTAYTQTLKQANLSVLVGLKTRSALGQSGTVS